MELQRTDRELVQQPEEMAFGNVLELEQRLVDAKAYRVEDKDMGRVEALLGKGTHRKVEASDNRDRLEEAAFGGRSRGCTDPSCTVLLEQRGTEDEHNTRWRWDSVALEWLGEGD